MIINLAVGGDYFPENCVNSASLQKPWTYGTAAQSRSFWWGGDSEYNDRRESFDTWSDPSFQIRDLKVFESVVEVLTTSETVPETSTQVISEATSESTQETTTVESTTGTTTETTNETTTETTTEISTESSTETSTSTATSTTTEETTTEHPNLELVFHENWENFDNWNHMVSFNVHNNEFQYYRDNRKNSYLENNSLVINATLTADEHSDWFLHDGTLDLGDACFGDETDGHNIGLRGMKYCGKSN